MSFVSLLPAHSGSFEKAIETVFGTTLDQIEPELIKAFWDPDTIPAEYLSVLAHSLSVDLWNESWDELKKRSLLKRWVSLEFLKGTYPGIKAFVEIAGGELVQTVVPPGGYFVARDLTQDEWETHIAANPRVRIQLARRTGEDLVGTFADEDFVDDGGLTLDLGSVLYGRRATFRMTENSADIDLQVISIETMEVTRTAVEHERVFLPAETPIAFVMDDTFLDDEYVEADDVGDRTYSYSVDRTYQHRVSKAWLNTVVPGFAVRDTTYYRVSDIGEADFGFYLDDGIADDVFLTPDRGAEMLADVLYLFNPEIGIPSTGDAGFLDDSFLDFERFRADLQIKLDESAEPDALMLDADFLDTAYVAEEDPTQREAVRVAINAAKAKRDKIAVTFQNFRPRTLADSFALGTGAEIGKPVPYTI